MLKCKCQLYNLTYLHYLLITMMLLLSGCSIQNTDMVLVLDLSGSTQDHYTMVTEFATHLVYGLDMSFSRTRLGIITFSTTSKNEFFLNTYTDKESIINAMRFEHYGGRTNIYHALNRLNEEQFILASGDRVGVRNIAVLVSDGYSNEQAGQELAEAEIVKDRGAEVYTIALGESPNLSDINEMSSNPDSDYVIRLRTIAEAQDAAEMLLDTLCR